MVYSVGVFCGSKNGQSETFKQVAQEIGYLFAREGIELVYGGGKTGLMGALANSLIEHNGNIKAVIPSFLKEIEGVHPGVTNLTETKTMEARKMKMIQESQAFLVLPGGVGTLDEFSEVIALKQLHSIEKTIVLLNCEHWADNLIKFFDDLQNQGFITESYLHYFTIAETVQEAIKILARDRLKT